MRHGKSALAAFVALIGLAAPAHAQQFGVGGFGGNAFGGNGIGFGGFGYNSGYAGLGYGTGFGVGYPNSYGYNGGGFVPYYRPVPHTYNNLGGLANSIRTQTGRANSYRPNNAVGGFRRR